MPVDTSKYLALFVSEATEHLEAFSREVVRVEKEKAPEAVDALFRHAHSIKGMAASMGFDQMAELAHRVEDLAEQARGDPNRLGAEAVDDMLSAGDHLLTMVRAAGASQPPPDARPFIARIAERLAALVDEAPAAPAETPVPAPVAVEPSHGPGLSPRLAVKVKIKAACPVPGVRAFLVYKKLAALGNIFDLKPSLDDLKAGRIPSGELSLELEGSANEVQIQKALAVIADLEVVEVGAPALAKSAPPEPAPEPPKLVGSEPARSVKVKTELLDYFLDSAGELLLATARLREIGKTLPLAFKAPFEEGVDRLRALVKDLHGKVMSVRMTPLSLITDRLPRAARDIARKREREVDLVVTGSEIELDRAILDELSDPLLHILRNCIDHGLEPAEERQQAGKGPVGRVLVSARRDRDRVLLEIEDDGRGMDGKKLKELALDRGFITAEQSRSMSDRETYMLCCLPGISTAKGVSEISGRGVGMDAVKRMVEGVGGQLEIESTPGRGTRFTLRLPLTVAVVNVLLVGVGREIYGLPIAKVIGALELDAAQVSTSQRSPMVEHAGALIPARTLSGLLGIAPSGNGQVKPYVVIQGESGVLALQVDRLLGQEEAVLKPLSPPLDLVPGLSGVTILGNGRPIFILDVPRLLAS